MRNSRGRAAWWLLPLGLAIALVFWAASGTPPASASAAASPGPARPNAATAPAGAASRARPSFDAAAVSARQAQLALWQQRLERAQAGLDAYRRATRYPHESRPAAEHGDQMQPNAPITEERPLRLPGSKDRSKVVLRTTQERVFVQGDESVRFTLALRDENGQALPLRVLHAGARELPGPHAGSLYPVVPMNFNDDGSAGDLAAADGVFSASLRPASDGFAGLLGQIRVEAFLQYGEQQGFVYFDILYSPQPPAVWRGGVREALEDGSLNFYLKAEVMQAGRYVVSGRVDDAQGRPFALVSFNEELAAGPQEIRLSVFGKLVRDGQPRFPLALRDVEGFLLRADAFPDRVLMPRLAGRVATSRDYPLASFSSAEWRSEERDRYLSELGRDVDVAKARVDQLQPQPH